MKRTGQRPQVLYLTNSAYHFLWFGLLTSNATIGRLPRKRIHRARDVADFRFDVDYYEVKEREGAVGGGGVVAEKKAVELEEEYSDQDKLTSYVQHLQTPVLKRSGNQLLVDLTGNVGMAEWIIDETGSGKSH